MSVNKRLFALLIVVAMLLVSFPALADAPAKAKVMPHEQPAGSLALSGGKLDALAFNNPDYTYAKLVDAGSAQYRNVGLRPVYGDKIVATKQVGTSWEIFLIDLGTLAETRISAGDSNYDGAFYYSNPVWSDDGAKIAWMKTYRSSPNKIQVYDLATASTSYLYEPTTPLDVCNFDFVGRSTTKIVFWDIVSGEADLFTYDPMTHERVNLTNSVGYKEYEPVSNATGDKFVYWSGETTLEPTDTTHVLSYNGSAWVKDVGFTPIPDTYWAFYSGQRDDRIGVTMVSNKDIRLYSSDGSSFVDLTGPGYSGGADEWNFFGSHFQSLARDIYVSSKADNASIPRGRDILRITEALPKLYLDPEEASVRNDPSQSQTFTVRLANAVDLYGYQFKLTYPKDQVDATAAFVLTFFDGTQYGNGWNATVDSAAGEIRFARTLVGPTPPLSGSGPLATVTFAPKAGATAGEYEIAFVGDILAEIEGAALAHTKQSGWLTIYDVGGLQGVVDLQGRSNESGAVVTIVGAGGYSASTTTNAVGAWQFGNVPAGSYQVNIEMARYLDAQKTGVVVSNGVVTPLASVKLLGGDTNDDDHVEIGDLSTIGGKFGTTVNPLTETADINADGEVNILDLVLAAGNYDKHSITDVLWS